MEGAEEKPDISDTATSVYDSHPPLLPLIEDIKHIPFLWYRKHRDFNNTPVKDAEYERLGLRHNMTGIEAKAKVKYLREMYSKERKLLLNQEIFGQKPNVWKYFKHLDFLEVNYSKSFSQEKAEKELGLTTVKKQNASPGPLEPEIIISPPQKKPKVPAIPAKPPVMSTGPRRGRPPKNRVTPVAPPPVSKNFDGFSSDDSEVMRLSPVSCPSPSILNRVSVHPESTAILQFIKATTETMSTKNTSAAAYLDYLRIKFEEKRISDSKFQEFVDWTTNFVKTL